MAERLPFGEIRPGARPLGSFLSPAQQNTAGAARPTLLDAPSGIVQLQQGSGGSVQGFNQFQQVASALAPFSRNLQTTLEAGIGMYAKGQIEAGYYDELKNQAAKSALSFQLQQEQGAINAAGQVSQLAKTDPAAAQLLQDSNPFRLIGRRRAAAQLAGAGIDNALFDDFISNQGELSSIQPGSESLMRRKAEISQAVMSKFGLSGDEPEAQFYTVPALNRAWDKYSERQQKLFGETLKANTINNGVAALGAQLQQLGQNGVSFGGEVIGIGDPRFGQVAGAVLTYEVDRQLAMLGGADRAEAVKAMQTQLFGTYGQVPALRDALTYIQGGNPKDKNRPTWGASNPLTALELTNRGNKARLESYEQGQKGIEQQLDGLWWGEGMPGSMLPSDPRYAGALLEFRNQATGAGYRDIDSYLKGRMGSQSSVTGEIFAPSPFAEQDFRDSLDDLSITELRKPGAITRLREQINEAARAQPTRGQQEAKLKELRELLDGKVKQSEAFTPGIQKDIDRALQQDLKAGPIQSLINQNKGGQSAFIAALQGGQGAAGAAGSANAKAGDFANRVQDLYVRAFERRLGEWQDKNPGQPLTPATKNVLLNQAVDEVRKGAEFREAYKAATGLNPGEVGEKKVGAPTVGTKPNAAVRGVPKAAAGDLPDSTVQRYRQQPVMEGQWLRQELVNVGTGKPVSNELYRAAKRAKTSTNRFLLEQLRFYPQLDPQGGIRKYLQNEVKKERQGQKVSSANYGAAMGETAYNPMAPGSWLMNMIMPPAAAATLPPTIGGGMTDQGFEIVQYVTGDVTAPHNGGRVVVDPHGHGGDHYHNHYEFKTVQQRVRAARLFRSMGFRVTSEYRPGDPRSHGKGLGLDVAPPLDLPRTREAEAQWSRQANAVLGFRP